MKLGHRFLLRKAKLGRLKEFVLIHDVVFAGPHSDVDKLPDTASSSRSRSRTVGGKSASLP